MKAKIIVKKPKENFEKQLERMADEALTQINNVGKKEKEKDNE